MLDSASLIGRTISHYRILEKFGGCGPADCARSLNGALHGSISFADCASATRSVPTSVEHCSLWVAFWSSGISGQLGHRKTLHNSRTDLLETMPLHLLDRHSDLGRVLDRTRLAGNRNARAPSEAVAPQAAKRYGRPAPKRGFV